MSQMTQEQLLALAQQWMGNSGYDAQKAKDNAKDKAQYWSPKNGSVVLRLLPPGPPGNALFASGLWAKKYFKYWVSIPSSKPGATAEDRKDGQFTVYDAARSCPSKYTESPIADALGDVESVVPAEVLKDFRSKARCLVNVYIHEIYDDRSNPVDVDMRGKIVIADLPISFFDHLRKEVAAPFGEYFNPYMGLPVTIQRKGQGKMGTEYSYGVMPGAARGPILQDVSQIQKMLESCPDLEAVVEANCQRDIPIAKQAAAKIREWGAALASGRFGMAGLPQAPVSPGGFIPGALPGQPYQQPNPQWPQQAQTSPQPQWPTMQPQTAPAWPGAAQAHPGGQSQVPPWQAPQQQPAQAAAPAVSPVQQPKQPTPVARPSCYGQFCKLNGNDPGAQDSPTNSDCKACAWKAVCVFESPAA